MTSLIEYSAVKSGIISMTSWLAKYYKTKISGSIVSALLEFWINNPNRSRKNTEIPAPAKECSTQQMSPELFCFCFLINQNTSMGRTL